MLEKWDFFSFLTWHRIFGLYTEWWLILFCLLCLLKKVVKITVMPFQ